VLVNETQTNKQEANRLSKRNSLVAVSNEHPFILKAKKPYEITQ
jgi:hypothetical protein